MSETEVKPEISTEEPEGKPIFRCTTCGFETSSRKGLAGHMRLMHEKPASEATFKHYVDEAIAEALKAVDSRFVVIIQEFMKGLKPVLDTIADAFKEYDSRRDKLEEALRATQDTTIERLTGFKERIEKLEREHEFLHKQFNALVDKLGYVGSGSPEEPKIESKEAEYEPLM